MGVDVGADEETDNVEERHPGVLREELLRESERNGGGDPADLHDGKETSLDGGADLVEGPCASDERHRGQVDRVLDGRHLYCVSILPIHLVIKNMETYNQIADQDLQNLSLQAGPASENLLQNANEKMAEGRGNEHAVQEHLRHTGAEVMAMFADIVGDPRSDELLSTRENTGSEHLRAQRVRLELLEIHLQITGLGLPARQTLADTVCQVLGFILELDRHGGRSC